VGIACSWEHLLLSLTQRKNNNKIKSLLENVPGGREGKGREGKGREVKWSEVKGKEEEGVVGSFGT
jgi:hypothetical protein